ncbi:hypothetical protein [Bacteriovorax sp. DB6_IX]|uniref:hypothetical protein n=1 Tax=Bacteriovorax sp. DB6_IX TaxID=1353530 RepID=UPI00038A12BB|nr:hypothetical protein [Bacteriovorax sp. DB6_IX]EQC52278.1 hypothetical protein M901_1451 [Bacteriovorax sp. DB6_IX]
MTKLLLLCSIFQMSHVYAQSEADLFEKAFGQRIKTKTISLPLLMDRTSLGEMNFLFKVKRSNHLMERG